MDTLARGDIVLYPFPYTDLSARKIRPCLVLSEEMGEDILLCQITSQHIRKDSHTVELKQNETNNGSLQLDSYIRANMLFTAETQQIRKKLCVIKNEKYQEVVTVINKIISTGHPCT